MAPGKSRGVASVLVSRGADDRVATQYELNPPPGDAISSVAFAPSSSSRLLVASWDKKLYNYDVTQPESSLVNSYEHRAPVLDVCFGDNDDEAYTAGMDWVVNKVNLSTGELTPVGKHAAPARCVTYSSAHGRNPLTLGVSNAVTD